MAVSSKEEKFEKVARACSKIISQKGTVAVTHSRVSKLSGVSRPWLYKYIGSKRSDLMDFAIKFLAHILTEIDNRPISNTKDEWRAHVLAGMKKGMTDVESMPWIPSLYFQFLGSDHLLGKLIHDLDKKYTKQTAKEIQHLFKLTDDEAYLYSAILTSFKMALNHRWAASSSHKIFSKDKIVGAIERFIKQI